MHPIRMRVMQYLASNEKATAGQISAKLPDIPRTTLYRHLNLLEEAKIILVVDENRIRGTVEKVYSLNIKTISEQNTLQNASLNAFGFLMSIYSDFQKYFESNDCNPENDRVFLNSATLMMGDEEYDAFLQEINSVFAKRLGNEAIDGRKPRRISVISSPNIK